MNPEQFSPEPKHESLLAFLLTHPVTPLAETLPEPEPAPLPKSPRGPLRQLKPETVALYAEAFRYFEKGSLPVTATRLALYLRFRMTSVLRTIRALESWGYIRVCGRYQAPGVRSAKLWEWCSPRDIFPPAS